MGSWGVYPKDSDFCLDLKSDIDEAVNQALEVLYEEYDNNTDNGLKLNNKLVLDFNKFNSDTLKNCVDSGVSIKVSDLQGKVVQVKDSKGELRDEFNSENELSRRFPLCAVKKGNYKCRDFSGRYVVWNEGLKDYVLKIDMVTKVV